jgi:hypothetical protein
MKLEGIHSGDLVLVDIKGRRFHAYVDIAGDGHLHVTPIERNISFRSVNARDVIVHWRRRGAPRARGARRNGNANTDQLALR